MALDHQFALNMTTLDGFRFESFYVEPKSKNEDTVGILRSFVESIEPKQNLLWGESQSGKTHLLQACCAKEGQSHRAVSYIPLREFAKYDVGVLEGLSHSSLVVLDDIDFVVGEMKWERALFNLINTTRDNKQRLLFSSTQNPRLMKCLLPDLSSRLIWGGSYQLQALLDQEKPRALQARAEQRGFKLSDRVIEYLYRRYPRDFDTLLTILDQLDKESLRQKTIITVPFVKQVLDDS